MPLRVDCAPHVMPKQCSTALSHSHRPSSRAGCTGSCTSALEQPWPASPESWCCHARQVGSCWVGQGFTFASKAPHSQFRICRVERCCSRSLFFHAHPADPPPAGRCVRRATGKALRLTGGVMVGVVDVMTGVCGGRGPVRWDAKCVVAVGQRCSLPVQPGPATWCNPGSGTSMPQLGRCSPTKPTKCARCPAGQGMLTSTATWRRPRGRRTSLSAWTQVGCSERLSRTPEMGLAPCDGLLACTPAQPRVRCGTSTTWGVHVHAISGLASEGIGRSYQAGLP